MDVQRPVVVRIPFSHFCQKAEWALTHAGIPYDTIDVPLTKMGRYRTATPTGLVPAMVVDGALLEGSDRILAWAAKRQAPGTLPLIPNGMEDQVQEWETWAGDVVGPLARREAYRVAYNDPWHFTQRPAIRLVAYLAHGLILNVLRHFKARRFDDTDQEELPRILTKVSQALRSTGTGYLLGAQPTGADVAVAALLRPLTYAAPGRDYHEQDGWTDVVDYVDRMRPRKTLRRRTRRIRHSDWGTLAAAARRPGRVA